jgi:hypothetical protein
MTCGLHQDFVKTIFYRVVRQELLAINNHTTYYWVETKKYSYLSS